VRMSRVKGRTDDLIIAQSTKFFPSQLREVIIQQQWINPHIAITIDRKDGNDLISVHAAISEQAPFFDEIAKVSELHEKTVRALRTALGLSVELTFVEGATLRREAGSKGMRVEDRRKL